MHIIIVQWKLQFREGERERERRRRRRRRRREREGDILLTS